MKLNPHLKVPSEQAGEAARASLLPTDEISYYLFSGVLKKQRLPDYIGFADAPFSRLSPGAISVMSC